MEEINDKNRSVQKSKTVYYSTVISIALVATMMGLFGLIMLETQQLSRYIRENITLNVILAEDVHQESVDSLLNTLRKHPYIKNLHYISKEAAADSLTKDLGEDFVNFLGYNPLLPSIEIHPKNEFAKVSNLNTLKDEISQDSSLVKEVFYEKNLVNNIHQNVKMISIVVLIFMVLLTIIAVALINNSIKLIIYSQRFLIKSMQLLGATKSFIRKPYLYYGFIHGLIGGITAIVFLCLTIYLLNLEAPDINILYSYTQIIALFVIVIAFAIILAVVSSFLSVNKFIKLKTYELY